MESDLTLRKMKPSEVSVMMNLCSFENWNCPKEHCERLYQTYPPGFIVATNSKDDFLGKFFYNR